MNRSSSFVPNSLKKPGTNILDIHSVGNTDVVCSHSTYGDVILAGLNILHLTGNV